MSNALPSTAIDTRALLEEAFARFNESSQRLESRHRALHDQIQLLTAQLKAKEDEVKRAERLAMLGETAAALAHEVRNPLGAIKLFLSLLRDDVRDIPSALTTLGMIDKSIETLDHLVSNILHFSKERGLSYSPINLHSMLHELVLGLSRRDNGTMVITLGLQARPMISADEHALRRAISNILLNAQQATKGRGTITVSTVDDGESDIVLTVRDDGPGIAPAVSERLFEPFVTNKNNGTGLGLAIVHQIIRQHCGSIRAFNDQGAVFEVRLPRSPQQLQQPEEGV